MTAPTDLNETKQHLIDRNIELMDKSGVTGLSPADLMPYSVEDLRQSVAWLERMAEEKAAQAAWKAAQPPGMIRRKKSGVHMPPEALQTQEAWDAFADAHPDLFEYVSEEEVQRDMERWQQERKDQRRQWEETARLADDADTRPYTPDNELPPEDRAALEAARSVRVIVDVAPPGSRPGYGYAAADRARRQALIDIGRNILSGRHPFDFRQKSSEHVLGAFVPPTNEPKHNEESPTDPDKKRPMLRTLPPEELERRRRALEAPGEWTELGNPIRPMTTETPEFPPLRRPTSTPKQCAYDPAQPCYCRCGEAKPHHLHTGPWWLNPEYRRTEGWGRPGGDLSQPLHWPQADLDALICWREARARYERENEDEAKAHAERLRRATKET